MHIKLEDALRCFQCRYIATVEIFSNFIGFDHIPVRWHCRSTVRFQQLHDRVLCKLTSTNI